jgi:hypothetical protein
MAITALMKFNLRDELIVRNSNYNLNKEFGWSRSEVDGTILSFVSHR